MQRNFQPQLWLCFPPEETSGVSVLCSTAPTPTPDEGTISSQMTSSNEGPAENASKVDQADPATQPFERRDDSTFFCVCCQMMVTF